MKTLLVISCVWVASLVILQSPNDKRATKQNSASSANPSDNPNQGQSAPAYSLPNGIVVNCGQGSNHGVESNCHTQDAFQSNQDVKIQRQLAKFTKYLVWVGALQLIALIIQAFVFFFTLKKVGRQAELMQIHADHLKCLASAAGSNAVAAKLNAQALINAERPWVMVQSEISPGTNSAKSLFRLHAFNYGKSPAHILSCKGPIAELVDASQPLPVPAQYGEWESLRDLIDPWQVYQEAMGKVLEGGRSMPKESFVIVYGAIEYSDGIALETYQTAFCYKLMREKLSDMGGTLIPYGPSEYNAYT